MWPYMTQGGVVLQAASEPVLKVRNLVKHFPLRGTSQVVHACEDVSLDVLRGETLGIVGESGSGKTTLGRCILRLIEPTSGEVIFEDVDITKLGRRELRRLRSEIQIVFQEPLDSFNPQLTIGYQIAEPLLVHKYCKRAEARRRVRELLGLVGLSEDFANAYPSGVSGGELQRCSIARAIATNPKLIVLDEPTSALPPGTEDEVITVLKDLQEKLGLSYVFISHDLLLVRSLCHRVAVMYLGQVVELGDWHEIFANSRHPYTHALMDSVLHPDPKQRRQIDGSDEALEGEIPSPIDLPVACYLAGRCSHVLDRCRRELQGLEEVEPGHWVRCWRSAEGELEYERPRGAPIEPDSPDRRRRG